MEWCGWHEKDQFSFVQPSIAEILGVSGRSKLGGHDRPHEYQVAVSFPGAEFVKGDHGHCSNLTDASGRLIATNGAEMAEAVREWLVEDWLGGDMRRGLTHIFIDKLNLQYCAGSVRAVNFGRGNPNAYAVLNENWAIYLREAFLEARVVVFLLNQDWLDSIPCNQEFEGLIRRKSTYATDGLPRAVVFVDITDPDYKGRLLPEYFANMRRQAARHFDVHNITFNEALTPEQKLQAQLQDMAAQTVQWRNWIYFGCLEGTNGWQELVDVQDYDWRKAIEESGDARWPRPTFQAARQGVLSRRFRLRVTRLGDGRFGEIQLIGWELFDATTGQNIVRPGNGFIRAPGGLNPASMAMIDVKKGAWCHKCGTRQYTWLEWLVPDDQPPVAVSAMRLSQHPLTDAVEWNDGQCPLDFTLECMPADVWPRHGPDFVRQYERPMTADDVTNLAGDRAPRWVQLHSVADASPRGPEGQAVVGSAPADGAGWTEYQVDAPQCGGGEGASAAAPACTAFRLRFLGVRDADTAEDIVVPGLRFQVTPASELRPILGGACSGSGGDLAGERCGPAAAFDGNPFTRWVDTSAGGIGNTAVWEYHHTGEVTVLEYAITSQIGTFGVLDGLHGAPRDWVLYTCTAVVNGERHVAQEGGPWVEVDRREEVIFTNTRQTKRFTVQRPAPGSRYRLVITAVRCGCASPSLQVGDIELLARKPSAAPEMLTAAHVLLHPSASHADMGEARWSPSDPSCLQLSLPIHPCSADSRMTAHRSPSLPVDSPLAPSLPPTPSPAVAEGLVGLAGATFGWRGSALAVWYEWPMEFVLKCNEVHDGEVVRYGSQTTMAYRTDRHRVEYGPESTWAEIRFDQDVLLAAYGMRNHFEAQPRGEPRSWRLEAWRGTAGDAASGAGDGGAAGAEGAVTEDVASVGGEAEAAEARAAGGADEAPSSGAMAEGNPSRGCWEVLHEVEWMDFDTRLSAGTFYLRPPPSPARRFRLLITEWAAPCPLAHLHSLHLLGRRAAAAATGAATGAAGASTAPPGHFPPAEAASGTSSTSVLTEPQGSSGKEPGGAISSAPAPAKAVTAAHLPSPPPLTDAPLRFREKASLDLMLRKRHGAVRLDRYALLLPQEEGGREGPPEGDQRRKEAGAPVAWVLEGLTTEY
ncbi:hypothetical protein GPECTOR_51g682 [Gonium pectorale]|uniref:Uncharacterized protein n=1 Tax=Gonium pectorale TaxID=33097 RepID=A0A150G776_GONPE|nr:hypothetical protein GPECTOR_51g682 [Gonium pectorale]|eukprot:KXZ45697.1 hypothetical protein GPECTOR_51g682 [Gonium pectorale]